MQSAMDETEEVIYAVVEGLLQKTQIDAREVLFRLPCFVCPDSPELGITTCTTSTRKATYLKSCKWLCFESF